MWFIIDIVLTFFDYASSPQKEDYQSFSFIINQNTKHLKPGEILEINGGMGSFSFAGKPTFIIAGKKREVTDDGLVHYTLTAAKEPGKYIVPIVISYIRPDGVTDTLTNDLEYFVDP